MDEVETAGRGDIDRLLTEWRSLLRQVGAAGPLIGDGAPMNVRDHFIAERWDEFRALARERLHESKASTLPDLPALTADQRRVVNHSILRAARDDEHYSVKPLITRMTRCAISLSHFNFCYCGCRKESCAAAE